MTTEPTIVAIIPARGGSKGLPRKNVRFVGGKPLIAHTILAAQRVTDHVYVSTDDVAIATTSRAFDATVIDRPGELAGDTATSESALLHALDALAAQGLREPDIVVFLQATSPLRRPDDLANALRTFRDARADSLFSATATTGFIWRCGPEGPRPLNYDPVARPRRQ